MSNMNTEYKHTPGPWYAVEYAGFWNIQDERDYEGVNLLDEEKCDNAEHNAMVAAAAAELLEVLKGAVMLEQTKYDAAYQSACIHNNSDGVGIHYDYASYPTMPEWVERAKAIITKATT
jgi:hypothetical protein